MLKLSNYHNFKTDKIIKFLTKRFYILGILFIALIITAFISIMLGAVNFTIPGLFAALFRPDDIQRKILFDIRIPRVLNAVLVGASLSASGIILQSLLRNNLAEPGLLGISAGAGLGAIIIFLLPVSVSFMLLTPVSFIFALLATISIFVIARGLNSKYTNFISSNKIILAGIAINALISSVNGYLLIASGSSVSQILFWLSGGLSGRGWNEFNMIIIFVSIGLISALLLSKSLNVLNLGEELSSSLGLNVKLVQKISIAVASLLAASAVSISGIISFIGLIVPNISKMLIGTDNRFAVPCAMLLGAEFFVVADTVARIVIAPSEIPTGIVISFVGAPVFIWLILKRKNY